MSNFFTTLVYFETLSVFTYVSIVVGMKKPKSSIYDNPAPTFWKKHYVTKTDRFIAKHQSWSDHKIHQIQHKFLIFFKHILFLLRFTLRISSSRSLSLWFFAMHIQCKLYIKKKGNERFKKEVNSSCEKSCQSNSKVKLNNFL